MCTLSMVHLCIFIYGPSMYIYLWSIYVYFIYGPSMYNLSMVHLCTLYSVMQSDGNNFCGDVVSDSFNKTFWDEDHILDHIYKSKYVRIIIVMILIFYNIIHKCILTLQ